MITFATQELLAGADLAADAAQVAFDSGDLNAARFLTDIELDLEGLYQHARLFTGEYVDCQSCLTTVGTEQAANARTCLRCAIEQCELYFGAIMDGRITYEVHLAALRIGYTLWGTPVGPTYLHPSGWQLYDGKHGHGWICLANGQTSATLPL